MKKKEFLLHGTNAEMTTECIEMIKLMCGITGKGYMAICKDIGISDRNYYRWVRNQTAASYQNYFKVFTYYKKYEDEILLTLA